MKHENITRMPAKKKAHQASVTRHSNASAALHRANFRSTKGKSRMPAKAKAHQASVARHSNVSAAPHRGKRLKHERQTANAIEKNQTATPNNTKNQNPSRG
jgi:hypothetical protein